jgi:hypothetical protein
MAVFNGIHGHLSGKEIASKAIAALPGEQRQDSEITPVSDIIPSVAVKRTKVRKDATLYELKGAS